MKTQRKLTAIVLGILDRDAGEVVLEANSDAALLVLSGEPLNEPIVGYGPFVMNSEAQIAEAFEDFNSGRFGRITPQTRSSAQNQEQIP